MSLITTKRTVKVFPVVAGADLPFLADTLRTMLTPDVLVQVVAGGLRFEGLERYEGLTEKISFALRMLQVALDKKQASDV